MIPINFLRIKSIVVKLLWHFEPWMGLWCKSFLRWLPVSNDFLALRISWVEQHCKDFIRWVSKQSKYSMGWFISVRSSDLQFLTWIICFPFFRPHYKAEWPPEKFGAFYHAGVYLNNIKNYHKYMPRLRKIFQFKKFLMNEAKLRLVEFRGARPSFLILYLFRLEDVKEKAKHFSSNHNFTFVSIHSRRTDYGLHLQALYNLSYVNTSYYYDAMEFYKTKFEVILRYTYFNSWHFLNVNNLLRTHYFMFYLMILNGQKRNSPIVLTTSMSYKKEQFLWSEMLHWQEMTL